MNGYAITALILAYLAIIAAILFVVTGLRVMSLRVAALHYAVERLQRTVDNPRLNKRNVEGRG